MTNKTLKPDPIDPNQTLHMYQNNEEKSVFSICVLNQQYVRDTGTLEKQTCIQKGQAVTIKGNYLLTAKHVIHDLERSYRATNIYDHRLSADITNIWQHPLYDLALIKRAGTGTLQPVDLDTAMHFANDDVYILQAGTIAPGVITNTENNLYTTTLELFPTDSGSPLFSRDTKKLVGINTATSTDDKTSYAVAITQGLLDEWLLDIGLDLSQ